MTNKKYPRLFRGGDPERRHDDVTGGLSDESESEQTSIRPHKVSDHGSKTSGKTTSRSDADSSEGGRRSSSKRDKESSRSRAGGSRDGAKRAEPRRTKDDKDDSAPKHAAGTKGPLDRSFRRSATLTVASALLPGLGLTGARQRWAKILGVLLPVGFLGGLVLLAVRAVMNPEVAIGWALRPGILRGTILVLIVAALGWAFLITLTHLITRPKGLATAKRAIGAGLVVALTFVVSAPLAVAARYTLSQLQLVEKVFAPEVQASGRPEVDVNAKDPWKDTPRLNILLLGADSTGSRIADNKGTYVPRTDTIMVASIDTATGNTTLVQIPRSVERTPFPEGSKLAKLFPRGFRGAGDSSEWLINAIWERTVSKDYPEMAEAVAPATYPGAEALKQGVEGITGLHMHYFALVNIDGLQQLIDAMGGVKLNVNRKLPIGGDHQTGARPHGRLKPGPDQLLDGYNAMWYARSRFDSDDYARMARQSCLVNAVIKQANPTTLLTSYEGIAQASSDMVMTDIPQDVLAPLAQLAFKVKDASVSRLAFVHGQNGFDAGNPDFTLMRKRVQDAINPPAPTSEPTASTSTAPSPDPSTAKPSPTPTKQTSSAQPKPSATSSDAAPSTTERVADACAYHPEE